MKKSAKFITRFIGYYFPHQYVILIYLLKGNTKLTIGGAVSLIVNILIS